MSDPPVHRRLAAILAADIVTYSRLMDLDEAGTFATWELHRRELIDAKIGEYGGRIVKLVGDEFLAEFPSVVNAVACAALIQRGMQERNAGVPQDRRIQLQIGVNLGDVTVEADDIYGDGVNVAARLQTIAKPGGIVISASVRENVGTRLDLRRRGPEASTRTRTASEMDRQRRPFRYLLRPCRVHLGCEHVLPLFEAFDGCREPSPDHRIRIHRFQVGRQALLHLSHQVLLHRLHIWQAEEGACFFRRAINVHGDFHLERSFPESSISQAWDPTTAAIKGAGSELLPMMPVQSLARPAILFRWRAHGSQPGTATRVHGEVLVS
jgi:class 3 adenylate cyclase